MKKIVKAITVYICALLFLIFARTGYASAGNGDGSGGGEGEPLALTSTSIQNGQIGPDDTITLTFSKNVINASVRDNNKNAFALYDNNGNIVPIEVIMADDQIEPDAKRIVSIRPLAGLSPGFEYTLLVSKDLQAKNGAYANTDSRIVFTVAGAVPEEATESAPPAAVELQKPVETPETSVPSPGVGQQSQLSPDVVQRSQAPADVGRQTPVETQPDPAAHVQDAPSVSNTVGDLQSALPDKAETGGMAQRFLDNDLRGKPNTLSIVMFICAGAAFCALIFVIIVKQRSKAGADKNV